MEIDTILKDLVDLHLHLGSASPPHSLWELGHDQGIRLPEKDYWKFIDSVTIKEQTTYDKYLNFFDLTEKIQSSTYAIEKACHSAVSHYYRKADVRTIEIRFNPMLRNKHGEQDLDKIIFSSVVGIKKACMEYPVRAGIILMMDRRFTKEQNLIIAQKAVKFKNDGIVGIDLAGPLNENFKIDDLVEATDLAHKHGIKVTIHTGEVTKSDEMWDVVKKLKPQRIGHGIRCIDDPTLMEYLAKEHIVLELCPSSNISTSAVKDWDEMTNIIQTLKKHNVPFTINTDGPELMQIDVREELKTLYTKGILTIEEIQDVINLAKKATFIP